MAKKSVTKQITKVEEQTNNTPQTTVAYKGQVTVKLANKNNKVLKTLNIKNTGTSRLFHGLALCLVKSNKVNLNTYIPNFMGIGQKNDGTWTDIDTNLEDTTFSTRYPITDVSINETTSPTGYSVKYTAIISDVQDGFKLKEIGLFGDDKTDSLLARIGLQDVIELPGVGFSWIVEWTMYIQNQIGGSN